jgi:small subunit ribosomal protein S10|uniref:ribosomal protein S10 n=1 Tax=Cryptomonas gyropyrenoidosa TaxID=233257 RepID=UPI0027A8FC7D|nr:ribosomal protein S10 [Cryptomonas gyropyrenoidosa]WFQ83027.1 ribosomal protein S10 [Cryptomonas gyropyrenoidosa]
MKKQKIRIKLNSYNTFLLHDSCEKIISTACQSNSLTMGPIPMPTKRKIYCVLRSPHVNKDSREHFETRVHKRIIDIYDPSSKTIDSLMKLDLPSGVQIEVKI